MGQIDTTSFARILQSGIGQGAQWYDDVQGMKLARLRQKMQEEQLARALEQQSLDNRFRERSFAANESQQSLDNRFRERSFAANESQRAFGNNLATQDQALQQASEDRNAQMFPLAFEANQVRNKTMIQEQQRQQQLAEQDRMVGAAIGPRLASRYMESLAANSKVPSMEHQMRAYAMESGAIGGEQAMRMLRMMDEQGDADSLFKAAEKYGASIEATMNSSKATPKMKEQLAGMVGFLKVAQASKDPNFVRSAIEDAARTQQQMMSVRDQGDHDRVAALFQRWQGGDAAARAELIERGQITPSAAFGGQRDTSAADDAKRRDEAWKLSERFADVAEKIRASNPALAAQYESQSRQLQRQALSGTERQTGPVLLSELDAKRVAPQVDQIAEQVIQEFVAQNKQKPTAADSAAIQAEVRRRLTSQQQHE